MIKAWRKVALLFVLLCFSTAVAQDATCGPLVQQALSAVENGCGSTGRNQACYGYVALDATPRDGVQNFTFAKAGDLANVADVETLRLSALDEAKKTWGIALMKLQANLPDTLPGQNVTFLMFGNVQVQNAVPASTELKTVEITSKSRINVRGGPSTNYGVIGSLGAGDIATANGRNDQSTWLRIQLPGSSALGWVSASLVSTSDVSGLSVFTADDNAPAFTPMQAFYFSTGIGKSACNGAPQDGILIQTPEGAGKIALRANDVDISLGSTGYLQGAPGTTMKVSVVEGEGKISSDGKTVTVPAGSEVEVPVDNDLKASGPPGDVKPYNSDDVANLPIDVLPRKITVADPASEQIIDRANGRGGGGGGTSSGGTTLYGGITVPPGMDICQALAAAGMSGAQYRAMIDEVLAAMAGQPNVGQMEASFNQIKQMVANC